MEKSYRNFNLTWNFLLFFEDGEENWKNKMRWAKSFDVVYKIYQMMNVLYSAEFNVESIRTASWWIYLNNVSWKIRILLINCEYFSEILAEFTEWFAHKWERIEYR